MTMMPLTAAATNTLTARTKATWMAGDFGKIAKSYAVGAAEFIARRNFRPGDKVLDVACGTGNLAIPAARTGAHVTGIDIAFNLIEQARLRARAERLTIWFEEGDAEQIPYATADFDAVVSMFGVMFAPRPTLAATELLRVCRPGGRIVLANWTPNSFIGEMYRIVEHYLPPLAGAPSPLLWGNEALVAERLSSQLTYLRCTPRPITLHFPFNPVTTVEYCRAYDGPLLCAFAALTPALQDALRRDLEHLWTAHNRGQDGTTQVESTYLEVMAIRK